MNIDNVHPQLRRIYRLYPALPLYIPAFLKFVKWAWRFHRNPKSVLGVNIEERKLGNAGVRIYRPEGTLSGAGMLWVHGGGYMIASALVNDRDCARYARDLNLVVVSVEYRLAPEYPFPCASDDCFDVWRWFQDHATELGVDPERIVIAGESAGAGLAAGLVQRIHDQGDGQPVAQLLIAPMIDDRTAIRGELDPVKHRLWTNKLNRVGWSCYLGCAPGAGELPPYAAPARREDLSGLPPAWIGVGDIDLFCEESRRYAQRLRDAGVSCEFTLVSGAPHGFEVLAPNAPITRDFLASSDRFLQRVLRL